MKKNTAKPDHRVLFPRVSPPPSVALVPCHRASSGLLVAGVSGTAQLLRGSTASSSPPSPPSQGYNGVQATPPLALSSLPHSREQELGTPTRARSKQPLRAAHLLIPSRIFRSVSPSPPPPHLTHTRMDGLLPSLARHRFAKQTGMDSRTPKSYRGRQDS
jgi:hypothetical protein